MARLLDGIPVFGSGMGYRAEIRDAMQERAAEIDVVEVITEHYVGRPAALERVLEHWPVIPHGISLSVGTLGALDRGYLRGIREVSELSGAPYYTEHLCFTRVPGLSLGHLAPLWFTEPVLRNLVDRVHQVQEFLGKPLVLENVTYMFEIPDAAMSQAEFFNRLVEATGCGVLLDLNNVYTNGINHRFDPVEFLEAMPLDHVVHVHLAGGYWHDGLLIDGHSHPVMEETWRLLEHLVARASVKTIILEHDTSFPETITPLLDQVRRARQVLQRERHGSA
jgi:uncharacterized protein (UPF0276 family)